MSKLQTTEIHEKDGDPTLLIAADTTEATTTKIPTGDYAKDAQPTLLITCDQV